MTDEVKEGLGSKLKDNQILLEVEQPKIQYVEDVLQFLSSSSAGLKTSKKEYHFLLEICVLYKLHSVKQKVLDLLKDWNLESDEMTLEVADSIMSNISETTIK